MGYKKLAFLTNISHYFENGKRYGHSYNGRRIGTRMRSIEWCHLQWPCVTVNLDVKVTIFWASNNSKMVQDRAIVTTADQYKVVYDLSIGAIFNDLERLKFQGHAKIRRWLSVTVEGRDIFTIEDEELVCDLPNGTCHVQWPWMAPKPDFKVTIFWTSNNSKMVHDMITMAKL